MRKRKLPELSISPLLLLEKRWAGVRGVRSAPPWAHAALSSAAPPQPPLLPRDAQPCHQPAPLPVSQLRRGDAGRPSPTVGRVAGAGRAGSFRQPPRPGCVPAACRAAGEVGFSPNKEVFFRGLKLITQTLI